MGIEIREFSSSICGFTIKVKVTKGEMFVLLKFDQAISTQYGNCYVSIGKICVRDIIGSQKSVFSE